MLNRLCQVLTTILLGVGAGWVGYLEVTRATQLAEITSAARILERESALMEATCAAQEYSQPLVHQNTMFMRGMERARTIVHSQTVELEQTREALNNSMELLQDQIEENNDCVDHIRKLESFIWELMEKIPENERPIPPTLHEEEELL